MQIDKHVNLKNRMLEFGVRCIRVAEALSQSIPQQVVSRQIVRSSTSVGANYRSACRSRSAAEFVARLGIAEEECDETLYWLDIIERLNYLPPSRLEALRKEGNELLSIIITSIKTTRSSNSKGHAR